MMRIITGRARGVRLDTLAGERTRPTAERTKEAVFSTLQFRLRDTRVLDLFAGSGQLGLEAISRGAREAVLIDMDHAACAAIKKNMETSRLGDQCRLIPRDYRMALDALAKEGQKFDVVFIDPPYRMENTGEMCAALYDKALLNEDFMIVVEHRRGMPPLLDERFEAYDLRRYGDTEITFVRGVRQEETENA